MKTPETLPFDEFAARYCERQECTPSELHKTLLGQVERFHPTGWMLLECHVMDSSRLGEYTILPYGPNSTWNAVPHYPISPRGLCSDMSVVVALLNDLGESP